MTRIGRLQALALTVACASLALGTHAQPSTLYPYATTNQLPAPCSTAPARDTLNGSVGSAGCFTQQDDTRPTAVQATNTTLNADCTWAATMVRPFLSSTPIIHAEAVIPAGSTQPVSCQPMVRSTTVESGKCFLSQGSTLAAVTVAGISVAVGGQVINPTASSCSSIAGIPIMIWGREPTQGN